MSRIIATVGGIGYLRPAPGTWASAWAIGAGLVLHGLVGFPGFAIATVAVIALGYWAVARTKVTDDPSEFVIDEVAGQWVALLPASAGFWNAGLDPWHFPWPAWVGAFLLFRLFDIWKPGPIGWADRKPGAMGIMLDDLIAGAVAGICLMVAAGVFHGVLAR